jgi:probable HAF family extracellular repeat protein
MIGLGDFSGNNFASSAAAASADGSVVAGHGDPANPIQNMAFRWTEATGIVAIGAFATTFPNSAGQAISADGQVIVGQSETPMGSIAYRWTEATGLIALGDLPGGFFNSAALAVSADGSIVVGWGNTGGAVFEEAFIWDEVNGMRNLREVLIAQGDDLTGWRLERASDISADGRTIVGWGINPAGQLEGWVATLGPTVTPIPEPSSFALAALGTALGAIVSLRRLRCGAVRRYGS